MKAVYYYNKYSKVVFITFLIGFTAHGYMFTNKIVNHDDITQLFSVGATVSSGRWGLWLLELLPNYSMPWLNGLISLLFVSIANCFLLEIFEINDKWTQYVLSGITVTFPSLIGIFTYMFTSAAYTFSFMLSVIAVYLVKKKRYFMGAACLIGSLSIYQAYISIAASLLLLVIIQSLLDNKDTIKKEIIKSLQFLLILGISMCLYYLIALVMRHLLHVEFNEYAQRGLSDSIGMSMLIKRIYIAMVNFYYFFSRLNWGLINTYSGYFISCRLLLRND